MEQKKKTIQQSRRERARQRDKRVLSILSGFLVFLFSAYLFLNPPEVSFPKLSFNLPKWTFSLFSSEAAADQEIYGKFAKGQQVAIKPSGLESDEGLTSYQNRLARVEAFETELIDGQEIMTYTLNFGKGDRLDRVLEDDLMEMTSSFILGQEVELLDRSGAARIEAVTKVGEQETYSVIFEDGSLVEPLTFHQIAYVHDIPLDPLSTAQENNRLIQEAMDLSNLYSFVVVRFPKGQFRIGSQMPESDYLLLRSNVELRGQETDLVVEGSARWFGLATGSSAYEGVSLFMMNGFNIMASDLVNGNQFLIMANHGHSWRIENNRFTLVHEMSSHIFDLGGLQDSVFTGNVFEGYAPNLTEVTEISGRDLHNFYAEAIQLDSSHNAVSWDGGMMRAIDPNYDWTSSQPAMSNNITISHNQFLPYYNSEGKLVAYGATVGQHSSYVGMASIYGNTFRETLATRFKNQTSEQWVLEPVHLQSNATVDIRDNSYQ